MPVIETYSSGGTAQYQKASSNDFADVRGLEIVAKEMGAAASDIEDWKVKQKELRDTENRLLMARRLAEGRQKWMIDFDKKRQAIEAGEMDYRGLTENFNNEYSAWAKESASEFSDPEFAEQMSVNLIEMQTSLMGSVMDFEARKRSDQIKETYDATTAPTLFAIQSARTKEEFKESIRGIGAIYNVLPKDVADDFKNKVDMTVAQKQLDLAETPEEVRQISADLKSGNIVKMSNEDAIRLANATQHASNRVLVEYDKLISKEMGAAEELSKSGDLGVGWQINILDRIESLVSSGDISPEIREDIISNIVYIDAANSVASKVWTMSDGQYNSYVANLSSTAEAEQNPVEKTKILSQVNFLQKAKFERDKALSENFTVYAMAKVPEVGSSYESYVQAANNIDQAGATIMFDKYINEVDAYAKQINWDKEINYLPDAEVSKISQELQTSLRTTNGVTEFSDRIEQYQSMYGNKFHSVMRQLRAKNPDFAVMSMIPRVQANGGNSQVAKNLIVNAMIAQIENPKVKEVPAKDIANTDFQDKISALNNNKMYTEVNDRLATYELVAKHLVFSNDSNALDKAAEIAFGDIDVVDGVVFPLSAGDPKELIYRANSYVGALQARVGIEMPVGSTAYSKKTISNNVDKYIEWRNYRGDGIGAVWMGTDEPVLDLNGNRVEFSWRDYSVSKSKWKKETVDPFNPPIQFMKSEY